MSRRVSITIPDELYDLIKKCARFDTRTISNLAIHATVQYMRRYHLRKGQLSTDDARHLEWE